MGKTVDRLLLLMKERDIDIYIVPSEDFHQSEYVGEYFKARAYLSGFTGSAGTVVATAEEVCLWTDGRYFLQAEEQLKSSGIVLQKMGQPGVPTVGSYVKQKLPQGGTLGFDGRVISVDVGAAYEKICEEKEASIVYNMDLMGEIWENRPAFSKKKAFHLPVEITGESAEHKVERVRIAMQEHGADTHVISSLDDTCWLLNMRGDDVLYSPLVLSYCVIEKDRVVLFVDEEKLNDELMDHWKNLNVEIRPYNDVYEFVKSLHDRYILLDPIKMNYSLYENIPEDNEIIEDSENDSGGALW